MAALAPLATVAGIAATGVQIARTVAGAQQRDRDRNTRIAALDLQTESQQAAARADAEQLALARQIDQRRRTDALRRTVAQRRAALSGQGVGSAEGSGEALLLGLVDDAAIEEAEQRRTTDLRIAEIGRERDARTRLNLLERARLDSRRTLDRLTSLDELLP